MQRKLCRLTHGSNEEANTNHCHQHPRSAWQGKCTQVRSLGKHLGVIQSASIRSNQTNTQNKAKVTHAVDQKCFHVGKHCTGFVKPQPNQQIRNQAHRFPTKQELQQVVAHHQRQHGEGEQRDVGKKAVVALVLFHVADGVDVHHQRNKGDHAHHHGSQAIHQEADLHFQVANDHPGVNGFIETSALLYYLQQSLCRQNKGKQHAKNSQTVAELAAHPRTTQSSSKNTRKQ